MTTPGPDPQARHAAPIRLDQNHDHSDRQTRPSGGGPARHRAADPLHAGVALPARSADEPDHDDPTGLIALTTQTGHRCYGYALSGRTRTPPADGYDYEREAK